MGTSIASLADTESVVYPRFLIVALMGRASLDHLKKIKKTGPNDGIVYTKDYQKQLLSTWKRKVSLRKK